MWARLLVRIDHTTESPLSNANSNRGRLGAAKKNVMDYLRIRCLLFDDWDLRDPFFLNILF